VISNAQAQSTRPDGIDLFKLREWYRKQYLKTVWWEERRVLALENAAYVCEGCSAMGALHAHHLSYHNLFNEPNSDLMVLCNICHKIAHVPEFEHETRGMPPAEKRRAIVSKCAKSTHIPDMNFRIPNLGKRWRK
jgi:5-methylcytosine-specific restriction endonuclease McrA